MRALGRQRIARWVAVASLAAAVALVALNMQLSEELRADVLLQGTARLPMLDQVTKIVGYAPSGISYGEGQMPLGLGAASGICDHGYCPQEGEGVQINPREVPTSPFAVRWDGFNWDTMDDDVNVFQPPDCLAKHLAGDESSCCEKDTEPCDKWGDGRHPHPEMRPYPIPPPVQAAGAPHGEEEGSKGVSTSYESYPGEWEKDAGKGNHGQGDDGESQYVHGTGGDRGHDGYDGKTIHNVGGNHGHGEESHGEYHYVHDAGGDHGHDGYDGKTIHDVSGDHGHGEESHRESHYVHDAGGDHGHDGYDWKTIHDVGGDHGHGEESHGESHYVHDAGGDKESWVEYGDGPVQEDYSFSDPVHPGPKGLWSSPLDHAEKALSQQALGARRGRASGASHSRR